MYVCMFVCMSIDALLLEFRIICTNVDINLCVLYCIVCMCNEQDFSICMYVCADLGWRHVAWESRFQRPERAVPGQRIHAEILFFK